MKVLLLELNEINWRLLRPLMAAGRLPTFARLMERSAWGSPVSVDLGDKLDPWITWTTVYTGKSQEEHGVYFLEQPPESIRVKRVWEMAADAGLSVGVYGSLNSWPPQPVDGFWVPGTFAQEPDTYPSRLRPIQELNLTYTRGYNYGALRGTGGLLWKVKMAVRLVALGLTPRTAFEVATQLVQERVRAHVAWKRVSLQPLVNFDLFSRLYRTHHPDLATFHTNHVAHYQHLYWRALQPSLFPQSPAAEEVRTYGGAIEHGYRTADRILRKALTLITPETMLIVASSMGQQPYINRSLEKGKRLLRVRSFEAFINLLGLTGKIRLVPTMADQFNIYADSETDLQQARNSIAGAYLDQPAQPMFEVCEQAQSLTACLCHYNTTSDASICHIPVEGTIRKARFEELVEMFDHVKSGYHHPEGMLIVSGPGIRPGPIQGPLTNLDFAPTILALLGVSVPSDLTGRLIPEVVGGATRREAAPGARPSDVEDRMTAPTV